MLLAHTRSRDFTAHRAFSHYLLKPEDLPALAHNEFLEKDVNKLAVLARAQRCAGILKEATEGKPQRSLRYNLLRPNGFEGELRASFVADSGAWGGIAMYRRAGAPDFETRDATFMHDTSRTIAEGIRRSIVMAAAPTSEVPDAPGLILIEDGRRATSTPAAERWLDQLISTPLGEDRLPPSELR